MKREQWLWMQASVALVAAAAASMSGSRRRTQPVVTPAMPATGESGR